MKFDHPRKTMRLQGYDYSNDGAYFITICVEDGHEILAQIVGAGSSRPQENIEIELSPCGKIGRGAPL